MSEYIRNDRGAKVFLNAMQQPALPLEDGKNTFDVLSVGLLRGGTPLMTVKSEPENLCYKLPEELNDWACTLVGTAQSGINVLPATVVITKDNGKYFADIL